MIEAAISFPLILVISIAILYLLVCFYQMVAEKTQADAYALRVSGACSDTYYYGSSFQIPEWEETQNGLYHSVLVSRRKQYQSYTSFMKPFQRIENGEFVVLNESDVIRKYIFFQGI